MRVLSMRARGIMARALTVSLVAATLAPASAQETISYTYDARGRLVTVDHGTSGPNANVMSTYTYDAADNRCDQIIRTDHTSATGSCPRAVTLTITPTTVPSGTVGTAYASTTITASGGTSPYTFAKTAGALPVGLTLSSAGLLSGTPTTAGTSNFTVTATDSLSNTGSQAYSITVGAVTLTLSPATLPNGTVGTAYSQTVTASGGSGGYTYAVTTGALPAGLSLNGTTGVLSGTPTTAASYSFTIKATDSSSNTGTRAYSITIGTGGPPIVTNYDDGGSVSCGGNSVEIDVVANDTGGVPPLSLVSATGATVVSSTDVNVLSGARAGTKSFTYVVQDSVGTTATGSGSITVTSPCQ